MSMKKEKDTVAGLVHKKFFDETDDAIKRGYFLEALCLEYAAMESRVSSIMRVLNMPCQDTKSIEAQRIGLILKINCLKKFYSTDAQLLEKSKLNLETFDKIFTWCKKRNGRIHRLYTNPHEYIELKQQNEEMAKEGRELAYLLYAEANRLKGIRDHHKERLENTIGRCPLEKETCINLVKANEIREEKKKTKEEEQKKREDERRLKNIKWHQEHDKKTAE